MRMMWKGFFSGWHERWEGSSEKQSSHVLDDSNSSTSHKNNLSTNALNYQLGTCLISLKSFKLPLNLYQFNERLIFNEIHKERYPLLLPTSFEILIPLTK